MYENNALSAGVSPDGLKNRTLIRLLICFVICRSREAFTRDELTGIICGNRLANYFEFCDALAALVENGSITLDSESALYYGTAESREIVDEMSSSLPFTVAEKASAAAERVIARRHSEAENPVVITELENGCTVECSILESGEPMMSISLYVPDRQCAEAVRENFYDNAANIYRRIFSELTGESSVAPEED